MADSMAMENPPKLFTQLKMQLYVKSAEVPSADDFDHLAQELRDVVERYAEDIDIRTQWSKVRAPREKREKPKVSP